MQSDNKAVRGFLRCLGDRLNKETFPHASPPSSPSFKRALGTMLDVCEQDEDHELRRSAKVARVALGRKLGKLDEEDAPRDADRENLRMLVNDVIVCLQKQHEARGQDFRVTIRASTEAITRLRTVVGAIVPRSSTRFRAASETITDIVLFEREKHGTNEKNKRSGAQGDPAIDEWLETLHAKKGAQLFDRLAHLLFEATD